MIDISLGKKLSKNYRSSQPFPHIVIDDFLQDERVIDDMMLEIQHFNLWGMDTKQVEHQDKKWFAPWNKESLDNLPKITRQVLDFFNSRTFLNYLTDLTGIPRLIADETFAGGGIHRIFSGGRLCVHTDYALHPDFQNLHRRLNLLLYLNRDWNPDWGGSLRLYRHDNKEMTHDIEPYCNRAVLFNTTSKALHGHPHPLACPPERCRYSLALYYFTEEAPPEGHDGNLWALWHKDADGPIISEF